MVASVIRFLKVEGDQGLESAQRAAIVDVVVDGYFGMKYCDACDALRGLGEHAPTTDAPGHQTAMWG